MVWGTERLPSATASLRYAPTEAQPAVTLCGRRQADTQTVLWRAQPDLLNSGPNAPEFTVENESDGRAFIRFGDDRFGRRPAPGTRFTATYRIGNGTNGNIGADSLAHIVTRDTRIVAVDNPLPATGGQERESLERVRQRVPFAFREQQRAVLAEDYARLAGRYPGVQRAAVQIRPKEGPEKGRCVKLAIDRLGGPSLDKYFKDGLGLHLEPFRLLGDKLEFTEPAIVKLEVVMEVRIRPGYAFGSVKEALQRRFGSGILPDGSPALFHPDQLSFGQSIYLSQLYAEAQRVEGVVSVVITAKPRRVEDVGGVDGTECPPEAACPIGQLEIPRLDSITVEDISDRDST